MFWFVSLVVGFMSGVVGKFRLRYVVGVLFSWNECFWVFVVLGLGV